MVVKPRLVLSLCMLRETRGSRRKPNILAAASVVSMLSCLISCIEGKEKVKTTK